MLLYALYIILVVNKLFFKQVCFVLRCPELQYNESNKKENKNHTDQIKP